MPEFDPSAFWGIAGIVVGIIVATIFFLLGKKKTLLQYAISTTPLITEKMIGILNDRMSIDGQPVNSLSSTTISFINSGNQRIKSSDFSEQEPLRVILTGYLYGYDVSRGNQKLFPKVTPADDNDNVLKILFENLKPRQFFSVTVLHNKSLEVLGELTTGTMRKYRSNMTFLFFEMIFTLGCAILMVDIMTSGYVSTLIGSLETLILYLILLTAAIVSFAVYISKRNKII